MLIFPMAFSKLGISGLQRKNKRGNGFEGAIILTFWNIDKREVGLFLGETWGIFENCGR